MPDQTVVSQSGCHSNSIRLISQPSTGYAVLLGHTFQTKTRQNTHCVKQLHSKSTLASGLNNAPGCEQENHVHIVSMSALQGTSHCYSLIPLAGQANCTTCPVGSYQPKRGKRGSLQGPRELAKQACKASFMQQAKQAWLLCSAVQSNL